jgi:c-di-GMP-binding flagellar brake protein YcgR
MYGSTLLGWKEHAWLVCEWPLQLGHSSDISAGTPCTVSSLHDGKLVGYRTEIREVMSSPVPLLFIAFPQTVEEMHLRKHARVSSSEPAILTRVDHKHEAAALISPSDYAGGLVKKDLSMGGRIAPGEGSAWAGATIRLEFELPGLGRVTNLTGIVKNADAKDDHCLAGFEFQFDRMEYIEYRGLHLQPLGATQVKVIPHLLESRTPLRSQKEKTRLGAPRSSVLGIRQLNHGFEQHAQEGGQI